MKTFLIVLLAISTAGFGWLAIRNATPQTCDELVRTKQGNLICLTNLGDVGEDEVAEAIQRVRENSYKW